MDYDDYGEIVNGIDTYRGIAKVLISKGSVLIGWTDQNGTHLDILFTMGALQYGTNVQGGIKGTDIFISIMRWGAFGFEVDRSDTHAGYYDEKLGNRASFGTTAEPLSELINGVKKFL